MQGTQITVKSVLISRFTMNNTVPKLQQCYKAAKFLLQSALYSSKGSTCKVRFTFLRLLVKAL